MRRSEIYSTQRKIFLFLCATTFGTDFVFIDFLLLFFSSSSSLSTWFSIFLICHACACVYGRQLMVTSLHNLETELSINIFNIALRLIAHQLDDFFIDSMIYNTKFSTGGASQFDFDMNRNLFALFGQYARRPDLLFKK